MVKADRCWSAGVSNVTALASYQSQQLGTVLLIGHADGSVRSYTIIFEGAGYATV